MVDVGYERRLANHLGAHRTPSILGVINGKVTFFHYAVAKEHLRQFVEDLLPQRLVERVNICLSSEKNKQLQSIRGRKTKTFLYVCQLYILHFLRIGIKIPLSLFQVTDKNDLQFLNSWHELNKPHVLLFDQVPVVPLLYKVGSLLVLIICEKYLRFS